jgi:Fur family ferric uptake transcriptional regulator
LRLSLKSKVILQEEVRLSPAEIRLLLRERGIPYTAQRALVTGILFLLERHVDAAELHREVSRVRSGIGRATVYRTLELLRDRGLASEREFGDGLRRYEARGGPHHDHLVCLRCGRVFEFQEPSIEALQEQVARRHGFRATRHRLELYGYCRECPEPVTSGAEDHQSEEM